MQTEIRIFLNGEPRNVEGSMTLLNLIETVVQPKGPVAAELNKEIVRRDSWDDKHLTEGDCIEVVHFVGGG